MFDIVHLKSSLRKRVACTTLLCLDVDGVMTDGRLYYNNLGAVNKCFNVRDGHGIKALQAIGVKVAIISGRNDAATKARATELSIEHCFLGINDKVKALNSLCKQLSCDLTSVAYMGDDIPDLAVMAIVGLSAAPNDADDQVKRQAKWISKFKGGTGAVRELCDLIISVRS